MARTTLNSNTASEGLSQLSQEFLRHISSFPAHIVPSKTGSLYDLDTEGLTLWNLTTRLMRADDVETARSPKDALLAARVFAFFMLDGALSKSNADTGNVARLMKVALKAAKCSIGIANVTILEQY